MELSFVGLLGEGVCGAAGTRNSGMGLAAGCTWRMSLQMRLVASLGWSNQACGPTLTGVSDLFGHSLLWG